VVAGSINRRAAQLSVKVTAPVFPGVTRDQGCWRCEHGAGEAGGKEVGVGGQHDPGVAELTRVWVGVGRRHGQQWNLQLRAATVTLTVMSWSVHPPDSSALSCTPTHKSAVHRDDARLGLAVVDVQEADGAGGLAEAVDRRSGIKDPDAVADLVERYMGAPGNDELRGGEAAT